MIFFFFFFFFSGCTGGFVAAAGLLQWSVGASLHCSVQASAVVACWLCGNANTKAAGLAHTQAKYLWHTGLVAPKHVILVRDQTCVP